jgi:carbon monoxide dehydrogenase subunit G
VSRVESVTLKGTGELDAFTEVLMSGKGKTVRADFKLLDAISLRRIVWSQQVENTPFARILTSAETEVSLAHADAGESPTTEVTIELRQTLHGFLARLGSHLVRRAAGSTIEEALDGLERIVGRRV